MAVNEPDGVVCVWNLHSPKAPEFVFHAQVCSLSVSSMAYLTVVDPLCGCLDSLTSFASRSLHFIPTLLSEEHTLARSYFGTLDLRIQIRLCVHRSQHQVTHIRSIHFRLSDHRMHTTSFRRRLMVQCAPGLWTYWRNLRRRLSWYIRRTAKPMRLV